MQLIANALAVALLAVGLVAPLSAPEHCEGDHESECATGCACVCCGESAFTFRDRASSLTADRSGSVGAAAELFAGRLLIADIFRPPISA